MVEHITHGSTPLLITALQEGPVEVATMAWPAGCGAEAIFVGRTRDEEHPQYGPLRRLEYEAFGPMVLRLLEKMAADAARRWDCRAVRLVHARGAVGIGQASVVIQVATPHRGDAFAACRYLIDRLKHELPIWKREIWARGETFVEGTTAHPEEEAGGE